MAQSWLDELEDKLRTGQTRPTMPAPRPRPQPAPPQPQPIIVVNGNAPKEEMSMPLFIFAMVMLVGILAVWGFKHGFHLNYLGGRTIAEMPAEQVEPQPGWQKPIDESKADITHLRAEVDELSAKVGEMDEGVSWAKKRIALLGTLHNNNFAEVRKGGKDFVMPDKKWQIDRYPPNLHLEESDKEFLRQFMEGTP